MRQHDQGNREKRVFTGSDNLKGRSKTIILSTVAFRQLARHGTGAVAESFHLIYKLKIERANWKSHGFL